MFEFEELDHEFAAIVEYILWEGVFFAVDPEIGDA